MGFSKRELTTLIVTHNSAAVLPDCLAALEACSAGQVLVVDNASSDGSVELARDAGAEVYALNQNYGFARAVNYGARAARSPFLCFLNPDCIVDAGLLRLPRNYSESTGVALQCPIFFTTTGRLLKAASLVIHGKRFLPI